MGESGSWRGRLWRWRWLLAALVLIVSIRIALPAILRRVLVSQATQNLRAQIDLGNLDLHLWRGGVVLEDFALRPLPPAPVADAPAAETNEPERLPPMVAFKRLAVGLRFRPLWDKTIQLYELTLEGPGIALDRLASGELNLQTILPPPTEASPTPEATPTEAAKGEAGWRFGIDHLAIGNGRLVFRDLTLPGSEPVEVGIPSIAVDDIALDPRLYGGPLNSRVKILLDEGSLELAARLGLEGDTTSLHAEMEAHNLPLRRSRLYIPDVGWSDLHGMLDASMKYELVTGSKNEVRGSVSLREVNVTVPDLPDAALAWKNLTVRVDPIDLLAQSATVAAVDLDGAALTVQPTGANRFPVLRRIQAKTESTTPSAAEAAPPATVPPTPTEAPPTPPASAPAPEEPSATEAKPWRWSLGALHITNSLVRRVGASGVVDIGVAVAVQELTDRGEKPADVDVKLDLGGGTLAVLGKARVEPPGFGGTIVVHSLSIPDVITTSEAMPESPVRRANLEADLAIAAGLPGPSARDTPKNRLDLRVGGKIVLSDVQVAPPGMTDLDVSTGAISLTLSPLDLPGILDLSTSGGATPAGKGDVLFQGEVALTEPRVVLADGKEFSVAFNKLQVVANRLELPALIGAAPGPKRPMVVALREVRLDAPALRLTRTEHGLVLPGQSAAGAKPAGAETPAAAEEGAEKPIPAASAGAEERASPNPGAPAPVDFTLATFQLKDGNIAIADRAVKPPFNAALSNLQIDARDLRWPELAARQLHLKTDTPGNGEIEMRGELGGPGGAAQLDLRRVDLPEFNPYATTYSPFRVDGGALSLSTKLTFNGKVYEAGNTITLHDFDLSGKEGESLFEKQFGVPLSTALALLRDAQGEISVDVPVKVGEKGTEVDVLSVVGGALRSALVNALTSPLRLLGAVTGSDDKVASIAPAAIAYRPGQAEARPDGEKRLEQLASFLASRPSIGVDLSTQITHTDVRWLREQELRRSWEEQGFFASLAAMVQGSQRDRIQAALKDRAEDQRGELSEEDTKVLDDWLAERPPPTGDALAALANARLGQAQAKLSQQQGVDAARVAISPVPTEAGEGDPEVRVRLKPANRGTPPPAGQPGESGRR